MCAPANQEMREIGLQAFDSGLINSQAEDLPLTPRMQHLLNSSIEILEPEKVQIQT